jgi:peptidoglycan/xylan/chitin deacetylase (PgdA/CDA1 family)
MHVRPRWTHPLVLAGALACSPRAATPPTTAPETSEPATQVSLSRLADNLWVHTSIRATDSFGVVPSHGLVVASDQGVLLLDSAWGNAATAELLVLIERELGRRPSVAVLTDFHDDRAGGSAALEAAGVEVWTSRAIIEALRAAGQHAPAHAFEQLPWSGELAGVPVEVEFPGAGHTQVNLVAWLPEPRILLGGCLFRALDTRDLGNLGDADIDAWGPTLRGVKARYPDALTLVPSHGPAAGPELLDHDLALIDIALAERAAARGEPWPTKMAITVDDLPTHGVLPQGVTRVEVHRKLVEAFERHGVPSVYGFVNGQHALDSADHRASLELWLAAGHPLGNHTWSHPNMETIGVEAFLADIDRNESVLAELTGDASGASWRSFRYPYLRQGFDRDSSDRVRAHLAANDYQIAEVSLDFWDWDYQSPYARCRDAADERGIAALRTTYLERATEMLDWHRAAALQAFERPISHVLLLHGGAFTAEMIDELLSAYEQRGVTWVTLDEALADPVYRDVPLPGRTHGDVIVEQAITTLGVPHPPWTRHPGALLDAVCR